MRLTKREIDAILDVLNEREAGGIEDLRDALGITDKEAELMMKTLNSAATKLRKRLSAICTKQP